LEIGNKNKDQANIMSQAPLFDDIDEEDLNKSINSVKDMEKDDKEQIQSDINP
jgi:5,10-methylene-tetrahydrofolate dehydrogenase/methenyl tetrahydrofolate cyclohydrolase